MNKIYINISIDTENMNTLFYNNKYPSSILEKGTQQIVSILNKYKVSATFFLSIFEHYNISNSEMKRVVELIKKFEVGLHTHPLWIDKENMHSHTLEEQISLIKKGVSLFKLYGLKKPIVHRAGAYGLDENTLKALENNHIFIDSSMFYAHENCKEFWSKNQIVKKEAMIEFPVTIFRRKMFDKNKNLIADKLVKTDINRMFFDEFVNYIQFCKKSNLKYINLFMHSYSLLNFKDGKFTLNIRDEKKLHKILQYIIQDEELEVVTFEQLNDFCSFNEKYDSIPIIKRVYDNSIKDEDNY